MVEVDKKKKRADELFEDYMELGSTEKVAKKYQISQQAVNQYLIRHSEQYRDLQESRKKTKKEKFMELVKEDEHLYIKEIAERLELSEKTVGTYAYESGYRLKTVKEEEKEETVKRYEEVFKQEKSIERAAKVLGITKKRLSTFLLRYSEWYRNEHSTEEKERRVLEVLEKGDWNTLGEISERSRCSRPFVNKVMSKREKEDL